MLSMYGQYLIEKTSDHILETDKGFITYRYLDDNKTVYIVDLYIKPDFRKGHAATEMADQVVELARHVGCTMLLGSVVPSNKNSTDSLRVLLAYGMSLKSSMIDLIVFEKGV